MGPEYGTDEWADVAFPGRGEPPSNKVVVDPDAEESPNVERPCGDGVPDD